LCILLFLGWDYGLHVDLSRFNPLTVKCVDWSAEGYQLWMVQKGHNIVDNENNSINNVQDDKILQLDFVKSALTVNPCMVSCH